MTIDYDSYLSGYKDGEESIFVKLDTLIAKWREESEYREAIASEDWVSNTLNDCIGDLEKLFK